MLWSIPNRNKTYSFASLSAPSFLLSLSLILFALLPLNVISTESSPYINDENNNNQNNPTSTGDFPFTKIIDILSENVEFSTFLRLIQKNGCIPYLNDLSNFTLFAPVNSAFISYSNPNKIIMKVEHFDIENYLLHDIVLDTFENDANNINNNQIKYVNIFNSDKNKFPFIFKKNILMEEEKNSNSNNEIEKDIYTVNDITIVDPNLKPNFQNAVLHGVSNLIHAPKDILTILKYLRENKHNNVNEKINYFETFLNNSIDYDDLIELLKNNTLFLPDDLNFLKKFNQIEINYIIDAFNNLNNYLNDDSGINSRIKLNWINDRSIFFKNVVIHGIVGGKNTTNNLNMVKNLSGKKLNISSNKIGSEIIVNSEKKSLISNILFENGLLHTFNDLDFIDDFIKFNTEKYLHGLNNTNFVRELYFRNLQHLIQNDNLNEKMTLFIPQDSSINDDSLGFTKSTLLYHFTDSQLFLEDEFDESSIAITKLFNSLFCTSNKKLGGNCQKFKITKSKNGYLINEKYKILHSKPYEIGNHLIYKISKDIQLPGDFISSINPFFQCSNSLNFLKQLDLLELKPNKEGYSIFLPCFNSWSYLDLNFEYIKKNETAQNLIMRNLILDGLIYSDLKNNTELKTHNHLNEEVSVSILDPNSKNDSVYVEISSQPEPVRLTKNKDIFFNQGVIHLLKEVYLPSVVDISLKDLIRTTGTSEFLDLLESYKDLLPIFNHDNPHSLLIPTSSSLLFEGINGNYTRLKEFLNLHIIPGNSTTNLINCDGKISTNFGESLICSEISPNNYLLKLENGLDNEVRILKKGCSTFNDESCIFLIDRPISLKWLRKEKYHLDLPGVALGVGAVLGALFILTLLGCVLLLCVGKSKKCDSSANNTGNEENLVNEPLLPPRSNSNLNSRNYCQQPRNAFESSYSSNSIINPIRVTEAPRKVSNDPSIYNDIN